MSLRHAIQAAILLLPATFGAQSPATLTVVIEGTSKTVAASSLQQLPRDTATMVFHDQPPVRYQSVSLAAVLKSVGVRTDSLRGPSLATRVVVEASDGSRSRTWTRR